MEEWEKDVEKLLETVARRYADLFRIAIETVADEVTETLEFVLESLEDEIFQAIEDLSRLIWFGEVQDTPLEDEEVSFEEYSSTFKSEPTLRNHPACVDCCNYHGESYGGNFFVCAMHPYGWDDENCPDWEQEAKKPQWDEPVDH